MNTMPPLKNEIQGLMILNSLIDKYLPDLGEAYEELSKLQQKQLLEFLEIVSTGIYNYLKDGGLTEEDRIRNFQSVIDQIKSVTNEIQNNNPIADFQELS